MSVLHMEACRVELCGDIYDGYGEIQAKYFFGAYKGEEAFLLLPYFPDGIICDFEVICDNEKFASAKAVNIRSIDELPKNSYISLENRGNGFLCLALKGVTARFSLEIHVTVCRKLHRHRNYTALTFVSPENQRQKCQISAHINIHGNVKKVLCPGVMVTVSSSDKLSCILISDIAIPVLVLNIFYVDNPQNHIIISRQPLGKNIGLCSFIPKLETIRKKKRRFDINISFHCANRRNIISALATLLNCFNEDDVFRVNVGHKQLTEFISANRKNIDTTMDLICSIQNDDGLCIAEGEWNSIVICNGAVLDNQTPLSGEPFAVFSEQVSSGFPIENSAFVTGVENEHELVIPSRFSAIYEKKLSPALIRPQGGIGVELLWDKTVGITANSIVSCFFRHDIIPLNGLKIFNDRHQLIEEIDFDTVTTHASLRIINVMYGLSVIKQKEGEAALARAEDRCIIRQEINDICLANKIPMGDIALICTANGTDMGVIAAPHSDFDTFNEPFREDAYVDADRVIELILKSQTLDGIIADITVTRCDRLILSTSVCLIALFLYKGDKYGDFARRSLDYLKNKDGFWAKTALAVWNNEKIDLKLLDKKLEMKIMCKQLHELALLIIKNHRRKTK